VKIKIKPLDRDELRDFNRYYDRLNRQDIHVGNLLKVIAFVGEAKEKN
jgi:hypothetical protein